MHGIANIRRVLGILAWLGMTGLAGGAEPPIIRAVKEANSRQVSALLEAGEDVNAAQGDAATALHWAAYRDDVEMAQVLIRAGARINEADDLGVTPLSLACLNGSAKMAGTLLDAGADPNIARANGDTPLMTAARVGDLDVVKLLLARGATIEANEKFRGQTALMFAVVENHAQVVDALLDAGADVKARSRNQFTPLLFAAQQGNVEIARRLLKAGAEVNESAPDGIAGDTNARSPIKPDTQAAALLVAIDSGHEAMARFLLERGADPNHHGAGRTALHSAVQQSMPQLIGILIAHSADPNARLEKPMPLLSRYIKQDTGVEVNVLGATPFWLAASYCDIRSMRILAKNGADTTLTSKDGTNPLLVAAGIDFVDGQDKYGRRSLVQGTLPYQQAAQAAVQLCLDLGADINSVNDKGQTALHGAAYFGGTQFVRFLVEKGARINAINKRGQTPWLITQGQYFSGSFFVHKETGELLEQLGAATSVGKDLGREWQRRMRETADRE